MKTEIYVTYKVILCYDGHFYNSQLENEWHPLKYIISHAKFDIACYHFRTADIIDATTGEILATIKNDED